MGVVDEVSGLAKTAVELVRAEGLKDVLAVLIELQIKTLDLVADNRELRRQGAALEEALQFKGAVQFRHSSYWTGAEDVFANGPYCTACFDTKRQAVRLHAAGDGFADCPSCKVMVKGIPDSISPQTRLTQGPTSRY